MPYIANTDEDRREMLAAIGVDSIDTLWQQAGVGIPAPDLSAIPEGRSEYEVNRYLAGLDDFVDEILRILERIETDPDSLLQAPHTYPVTRLDETRAARHPDLASLEPSP